MRHSLTSAKPSPLGSKFLQSIKNEDRPAAGVSTPHYRAPSPRIAPRWNGSTHTSPTFAKPNNNIFDNGYSSDVREPSPIRKGRSAPPKDNLNVGLTSGSGANTPTSARAATPRGAYLRASSVNSDHLRGAGAHVDPEATIAPRARGKHMVASPPRASSARPQGIGQAVYSRRSSDTYIDLGTFGPDPEAPKVRPTPEPMNIKPLKRGTRYVPEPQSHEVLPRYSEEATFRHGKRYIPAHVKEDTIKGLRTSVGERHRVSQIINFVGEASPLRAPSTRTNSANGFVRNNSSNGTTGNNNYDSSFGAMNRSLNASQNGTNNNGTTTGSAADSPTSPLQSSPSRRFMHTPRSGRENSVGAAMRDSTTTATTTQQQRSVSFNNLLAHNAANTSTSNNAANEPASPSRRFQSTPRLNESSSGAVFGSSADLTRNLEKNNTSNGGSSSALLAANRRYQSNPRLRESSVGAVFGRNNSNTSGNNNVSGATPPPAASSASPLSGAFARAAIASSPVRQMPTTSAVSGSTPNRLQQQPPSSASGGGGTLQRTPSRRAATPTGRTFNILTNQIY